MAEWTKLSDVADQSRARTLAQGLGLDLKKSSSALKLLDPRRIAKKADATLMFYWLGPQQSYLWAINDKRISLFTLPPEHQITALVSTYRNLITGPEDPLRSNSQVADALYNTLIAPSATMVNHNKAVMILADGELSQFNFETLVVPGFKRHYWIEDVTLVTAPSLSMLASARPSHISDERLLMLGNAISADDDYPELPNAAEEMRLIPRHFASANVSTFARQRATPTTYFAK